MGTEADWGSPNWSLIDAFSANVTVVFVAAAAGSISVLVAKPIENTIDSRDMKTRRNTTDDFDIDHTESMRFMAQSPIFA
ncbi:MAG: hypothetical protein ACYC5Z_02430 [Acidimicrobiales bacterium]